MYQLLVRELATEKNSKQEAGCILVELVPGLWELQSVVVTAHRYDYKHTAPVNISTIHCRVTLTI